ncbi:MAG: hypothetical protein ACJAZZ_001352 [Dokdonia donghaensis]
MGGFLYRFSDVVYILVISPLEDVKSISVCGVEVSRFRESVKRRMRKITDITASNNLLKQAITIIK